jgi:isocitrate dehydrogenase (NAD+)
MATPVTLIPGDGIGPSITDATLRILDAAGADLVYDGSWPGWRRSASAATRCPTRRSTPSGARALALKGPLETPGRARGTAR